MVLLCSDEPHHRYLAHLLCSRFDLAGIVSEPGASQLRAARRARRYRDYFWGLYHQWRRRVLRLSAYRARYFAELPSLTDCVVPEPLEVDSINSSEVRKFLRRHAPDLVVIAGTTILKRRVLEACGELVLNLHGGYLPDYRGNHSIFFALYNSDFDRVGSTIHFVDPGIDTGNLVDRAIPEIRPGDNAEKLYCRAEMMGIHLLADWIRHWQAGGQLPRRPQGAGGRMFRTRDRKPHHDLRFWMRRRFGIRPVPGLPAPEGNDRPFPLWASGGSSSRE